MNNNTHYQSNNNNIKTLSATGAVLYSAFVTVLAAVSVLCMRTDPDNAVLCFFVPVFLIGAGYFATALLVHKNTALFCVCAAVSVLACFALTLDILRSLVCLGAFAAALSVHLGSRRKYFTQSGMICLCSVFYAVFLFSALCILCYQKYGSVGVDTFTKAYNSFVSVIMQAPLDTLEIYRELYTSPEYASVIESYEQLTELLRNTLELMLYSVPSLFLCICSIGGFITVRASKRHRKMSGLPDTIGPYRISVTSAAVYIILTLISLFSDGYSALGITVSTVGAVLGLGLAVEGFIFVFSVLKRTQRAQLYTALLIIAVSMMPGLAQSLLALVGVYHSFVLMKMRRDINKTPKE